VPEAVIVSAKTGAGIPGLCEQISRRLVTDPPPQGAAVPFRPEFAEIVDRIAAAVGASDIRAVQWALEALESSSQLESPG
jgi:hypothetical protein